MILVLFFFLFVLAFSSAQAIVEGRRSQLRPITPSPVPDSPQSAPLYRPVPHAPRVQNLQLVRTLAREPAPPRPTSRVLNFSHLGLVLFFWICSSNYAVTKLSVIQLNKKSLCHRHTAVVPHMVPSHDVFHAGYTTLISEAAHAKVAKCCRFLCSSVYFWAAAALPHQEENEVVPPLARCRGDTCRGPRASPWPSAADSAVPVQSLSPHEPLQHLLQPCKQLVPLKWCLHVADWKWKSAKISCQAAFQHHRRLITTEMKTIFWFSFPACNWKLGK